MPAKYSHVKKRSASGLLKRGAPNGQLQTEKDAHPQSPNPRIDRSLSQAMTVISQLERGIARIFLIRYEQDIARLLSTRLYNVSLVHLPALVMRCVSFGGPSWVAYNYDCDEIKDFFRSIISMDMRQAGERVATKSVLWSYTALRHFALSNNVPICEKRGLQSLRLLPHFPALKKHLDVLESMPPASFSQPPHLGSLREGHKALEEACELKYCGSDDNTNPQPEWEGNWREKVRVGYEKLTQTLWRVAREFDVRGYGLVLREKLTTKWCDCGCSTDHLGEVCERAVREDEIESGVRFGKQREWDGRGSGVYGWETDAEEDIWEADLDFGGSSSSKREGGVDADLTIGELMEQRYFKAERQKDEGNTAFRKGDFQLAAKHYETAHEIEPELPHYQLNLAAAHLKLNNWVEAEAACTKALGQHRSGKGYYRRARARRMLGHLDDAVRDLHAVLKIQPTNAEANAELASLLHPEPPSSSLSSSSSSSKQSIAREASSSAQIDFPHVTKQKYQRPQKQPPFPRTKADDRKLKIVFLSSAMDVPIHDLCSLLLTANLTSISLPNRRGKKMLKNGTAKELEEIKSEKFIIPSWERYTVKKLE